MKKRVLILLVIVLGVSILAGLCSCKLNNVLTYTYYDGNNEYVFQHEMKAKTGNVLNYGKRTGYTFLGYFTEDGIQYFDENGVQLDEILIEGSMRLYPKYQPHTFDFNFRTSEGTLESAEMTVSYGQSIGYFPNVTYGDEMYELDGWFNKNGDVRYSNGTTPVNSEISFDNYDFFDGSLTLYAKKKVKTYTVTVNFNDGKTPNAEFEVSYGQGVGKMSEYYMDNGTSDICEWTLEHGIEIPSEIYSDITVYAVWKNYRYVTFVYGEYDERKLKVHENYGESSVLPTEGKPGYKLVGWYENELFSGNPFESVVYGALKDKYYGKFEETTYKITFNEYFEGQEHEITYSYGDALELPVPTKEGYTFLGWVEKGSDLGITSISSKTWGDKVLYPKWAKESDDVVTVYIDFSDGAGEQRFRFAVGEVIHLPVIQRRGLQFVGWFMNGQTELDNEYTVSYGNYGSTLKAKYVESHAISTPEELLYYIELMNRDLAMQRSNYHLVCDIDMAGVFVEKNISTFNGIFNGNNFRIKNLELEDESSSLAFIGSNYGEIRNLNIVNAKIKNTYEYSSHTAVLAGSNLGLIKNCSVTGSIKAVSNQSVVGGLVASNDKTVENSSASVDIYVEVDGLFNRVGGFVGKVSGGAVTDCTVNADITVASKDSSASAEIGLMVGELIDSYVSEAFITSANAKGKITLTQLDDTNGGIDANVGGFVGVVTSGKITGCYAELELDSAIEANIYSMSDIGGFVGLLYGSGTVTSCAYNEGDLENISFQGNLNYAATP